jgi:hypothetical protein
VEFEEQMSKLFARVQGDKDYLVLHHPDMPDGGDDAPDPTALALLRAARRFTEEILLGGVIPAGLERFFSFKGNDLRYVARFSSIFRGRTCRWNT